MTFSEFAIFLKQLEETASRNDLTVMLSEFLGKVTPNEAKLSMYLIQGRLVPKYVDLEFNFSRKLALNALGQLLGEEGNKEVKAMFKELGDVGLVAESIVGTSPSFSKRGGGGVSNSIEEVYSTLEQIARFEGKGSQEAKMNGYVELISSLDGLSARYISRIIIGSLRLGLSDKTVLDSLSWYVAGDKSVRKNFDVAFGARADIGELAALVIQTLDKKLANNPTEKELEERKNQIFNEIKKIKLVPGTPVASKLVERESSPEKVWERMPNCWVQPKLDGLRGQLHLFQVKNSKVKSQKVAATPASRLQETKKAEVKSPDGKRKNTQIFSRNMENMTEQFPDLNAALKKLKCDSIVLDSEIVGIDQATGEYKTYQETMQRKRKYDVDQFASDIPVKAMCFDVLYFNGKDMTTEPIEKRLEILREIIENSDQHELEMLETLQMKTEGELIEYFEAQVGKGLEGLITKEVGSSYEPGTRNYKWIKLKANSRSELVDTIDVTVIGYFIGRGQRAKHGIGAFLTAVYDPKEDRYYSVGKVGSGIKDGEFEKIRADLDKLEVDDKPENVEVEKQLYPDVWTTPNIVIEIDADEITRSPSHTAARGIKTKVKKDMFERGLSVRFPRLKIWNRDKGYPNTVEELVKMYEMRKT